MFVFKWQVANYSAGCAAEEIVIHGFISSNMGGSCKFKIHARMPLLYIPSRTHFILVFSLHMTQILLSHLLWDFFILIFILFL